MSKLQEENLKKLCEWFDVHHISYERPVFLDQVKVATIGTNVCKIAVCVCAPEEESEAFELTRARHYHPFFIREGDTWEFTHEKIRNCTRGWNIAKVKKMEKLAKEKAEKEATAPKPKRKRVRIHHPVYEKVEPTKH